MSHFQPPRVLVIGNEPVLTLKGPIEANPAAGLTSTLERYLFCYCWCLYAVNSPLYLLKTLGSFDTCESYALNLCAFPKALPQKVYFPPLRRSAVGLTESILNMFFLESVMWVSMLFDLYSMVSAYLESLALGFDKAD